MDYPLIFDENGALFFCKTKEDAENYLEAADIFENEYIGYDSKGRLLSLSVENSEETSFLGFHSKKYPKIIIKSADSIPQHYDELHRKLVKFYSKINPSDKISTDIPLEEILKKTIDQSGYCL